MNSYYRNCNHHEDSSGMGGVLIVLGFLVMPLVGVYMLLKGEDTDQQAIGLIITIIGRILWITVACQS